jgi:hypothetical protein
MGDPMTGAPIAGGAMTGTPMAGGVAGTGAMPGASPIAVAPADLGGDCPLERHIGGFEVTHRQEFAFVTGEVTESVIPLSVTALVAESGGCRLMRKDNPHCEVPCSAGQVCGPALACVPFPAKLDVGTVTIEGLREPITMLADAANSYSAAGPAFPLFEAGDGIRLTTTAADVEAITLHGIGVEPLVLTNGDWVVRRDQPLDLAWTPGATGARVRFTFNVDQHGNSPVTMVCDVEDTGGYQIDASMVNALIDAGVSGAGSANAYRETVDSATVGRGCIDLRVASHVRGRLRVE